MRIEEAIQQPKFRNPRQKALINLIFTHNWAVDEVKQLLKPTGTTLQQFNVLRILKGSHPEPLSTLAIRERMLDKMSDASRIVDRLEKKGLVKKKSCSNDKRLVDIIITGKGLKLIDQLDQLNTKMDNIMAGLTFKEAETLNTLLDKIRSKQDE